MDLKTYITDCNNFSCIHNSVGECELHAIALDDAGQCKSVELAVEQEG